MAWHSEELQNLSAVVVATIDLAGKLVEANRGFLRLLPSAERSIGETCAKFFIQPNFVSLLQCPADSAGKIYEGLLTIGEYNGQTRTLKAKVLKIDAYLRLIAEPDIDELERLQKVVLELNDDYAT